MKILNTFELITINVFSLLSKVHRIFKSIDLAIVPWGSFYYHMNFHIDVPNVILFLHLLCCVVNLFDEKKW